MDGDEAERVTLSLGMRTSICTCLMLIVEGCIPADMEDHARALVALIMMQQLILGVVDFGDFENDGVSLHAGCMAAMPVISSSRHGRKNNPPSRTKDHRTSLIARIIEMGSEKEFRRTFRLSRNVYLRLVHQLAPYVRDGRSIKSSSESFQRIQNSNCIILLCPWD